MRKFLMASAALALVSVTTVACAQPGYDDGYYRDRQGYYDRGYPDRGDTDRYNDRRDDRYYREGEYEDKCRRNNNIAGTIFGAIAGGLIGGAASHGNGGAVVGGVVLGGLLGNALTHDMPCEDHPYAMHAYAEGLDGPVGDRYNWRHGDDYGYFVPERQYYRGDEVCRTFTETTYARGNTYTRSGTACRHEGGDWRFD